MWKRILKKVISSEKFIDMVLVIVFAAFDGKFTDEEKKAIQESAAAAVMDALS